MSPYRHDRETRIRVLEELLAEARGEPAAHRRREPPPKLPGTPDPLRRDNEDAGSVAVRALLLVVALLGYVVVVEWSR